VINETLLLEILGPRFLQYVLNVDEAFITANLHGSPLDEFRAAIVQELTTVLGQLVPNTDSDPLLRQLQLDALGSYVADYRTSYANVLRVRCGGSIALTEPSDSVEQLAARLARDMYPLFLLPSNPNIPFGAFSPSMTRSLFHHPDREAFEMAVTADPELRQLFQENNETIGRHGHILSSAGRGGDIQLTMFAERLIRNGWQRLRIENRMPTLAGFVDVVVALVAFTRDAVMGRPLTTTARIGLIGLRLPDETPILLPWGRLRGVREDDRADIPSSTGGALMTTTAAGHQVVIDYSGDIVMETDIPYRIRIGAHDITAGWPADLRDSELVQRRVETVQLGLLLALPREPQPMVVVAWQKILDPLSQGASVGWNDTRRTPNLVPYQLAQEDVDQWVQWIADVDTHRIPSIEVAIRRTIRSVIERADPSDALVDAVIAWENLVGSREGEPTLRVSAALAHLLETSAEGRRSRQTAIKKLYNVRSDVVHGNRSLDPQEAWNKSREARMIAVDALRKLFRDRPELLHDCNDGNLRSLRLIVG
jgi:Apea-like HEPN